MVVFVETEPYYVLVKNVFFFMKSWSFLIKNGLFGGQIYFWNILNWFQLNLSKMMQLNWLQSQAEEIFSKKKSPKITNTRNGCLGGGGLVITRGARWCWWWCICLFSHLWSSKLKISQFQAIFMVFHSCPVWNIRF